MRAQEFQQSSNHLKRHLGYACFLALARSPWRKFLVDCSLQRRAMTQGFFLVVSCLLSKRIKSWSRRQRVGIIFPPGIGGYVANLAVVLAGRVPVNFNFTQGPAASRICIRQAEVDCVLTTAAVQRKFSLFPWSEVEIVDLIVEIRSLPRFKFITLLATLYILPATLLAKFLGIPRVGGAAEAGLLFTSGSSGEPKGVSLSHGNLLANCAQIAATGLFTRDQKILANLPIFHSFGFTITLWFPLLSGLDVVTITSPLEVKKAAEVIAAEQVTILVGTPTFLKPYLKRIEPLQLESLRYAIAGAEQTPSGFAAAWTQRFGSQYLEGYGLTETSPVVSLNLPHAVSSKDELKFDQGCGRPGSVGRLLPGLRAQILDPETREQLALNQVGMIALKGPNVFSGYLNDPDRTAAVKHDDWFLTGDLGCFDADGFLYIKGRLSRFSKIAGEMVPHGTVEDALIKVYQLQESDQPMLAIAGRADSLKGEVLVLLTVAKLESAEVRKHLSAAGFSNLWIPKIIKQVDLIPVLATGKLDLKAIQQLAQVDA